MKTSSWAIGEVVQGRWEVHRVLQGGMGVVYVVYHREAREALAVKTFQDEVFARNPLIADRFANEASAWINLDHHENVVIAKFLQRIEWKPYLFLEYVSGGDLASWIHSRRLVGHLSPESDVLKITDFGLVKIFQDDQLPGVSNAHSLLLTVNLTHEGTPLGTCTHMPPEQFDDAKSVDVRADVYSFGVMLFEMLTGSLRFTAKTWAEFEWQHKNQRLPRTPGLDRQLRRVLEKCTAKAPQHRFGDFAELRKEIGAAFERLTGLPTPKPRIGSELDAYSLVNKGFSLRQLGKENEGYKYYEQALTLHPNLAEAWLNKGGALGRAGQHAEALRCFDRCLQINPNIQQAWQNKGRALFDLGRDADAIPCFEKAHTLNPKDVDAWRSEFIVLSRMGRVQEAGACLERCLKINPDSARAWCDLGEFFGRHAEHSKALACFDKATMLDATLADAWLRKGDVLGALARYLEALTCFQEAEKLGDVNAAKGISECQRLLNLEAEKYFRRGSGFQEAGDDAEAIRCYV